MIQYTSTLFRYLLGACIGKYKLFTYKQFNEYVSSKNCNVLATPIFLFPIQHRFRKTHGYKIWFCYNHRIDSWISENNKLPIDAHWSSMWFLNRKILLFKIENYKDKEIEFYAKHI